MNHYFRIKSYLITVAFSVFLPLSAVQAASWTILVYGNADHNLTPSLIKDMKEMEVVGSSENFNIVVQADFNTKLEPELAGGFRYLMQTDTSGSKNLVSNPVEKMPEPDMDDPAVLAEFLRWGVKSYPAEHYALVLWDHGNQWVGFGGDIQDGTRQGKGLSIRQIAQTISQVREELSLGKFDFISFDTCLMGGAEVLSDFVAHTDTFLANPEIDFGKGLDYTATLAWLKSNPDTSMKEFAVQEATQWKEHHSRGTTDKTLQAHVAYDLKQYANFQTAVFQFFTELNRVFSEEVNHIARTRRQVSSYNVSSMKKLKQPTDFIDLGEFADKLAQVISDAAFKQSAQDLSTAIDNMIVAKVLGTNRQEAGAHGLSIFYPVNGKYGTIYPTLDFPKTNGQNPQNWITFLDAITGAKQKDNTAPEISDITVSNTNPQQDKPVVIEIPIKDEDVVALSASIISKTVEADKQIVFNNGKVVLPEVAIPNQATGLDDYYQVTLSLSDASAFRFTAQLAPEASDIPDTQMSSTFTWENMILHVPILYVDSADGRKAYQVDLQVTDLSKLELTLTSVRPAEQVFYLSELAYETIDGPGTYEITWDATLPVFSSDNGETFSYLSGFSFTADSELINSMALYMPKDSEDIQFIILQTQPSTGKILGALDAETTFDDAVAPRGLELEAGGTILPMYYGEVRTDQDPETWDANLFAWGDTIEIPATGVSGLELFDLQVTQGDYILEISAEDAFGNISNPREFALKLNP